MLGLKRHPAYRELSEFSDGTLPGHDRVASHLEGCAACRNEVRMIRDADEAMRRVPVPDMPDGMLERVLERRAADIRTILPATAPSIPRRRVAPAGLVTVTIVLGLAAAGIVALNRDAAAGASVLEMGMPTSGVTSVPLRYEPGSALAGATTVEVRARVWSASGGAPTVQRVGTLSRAGRALEGSASLPADAAYALIALEDPEGKRIDLNRGEFWEFVAGGSKPTPAARAARLEALQTLSGEGLVAPGDVRSAAVSAARAAPDDPGAWSMRAAFEHRVVTDAMWEELLPVHRERLAHFEEVARAPNDLAVLFDYATELGDGEAASRVLRRLADVAPGHELVARERVYDLTARLASDPIALLRALDEDWTTGNVSVVVAGLGYAKAMEIQDVEAIGRWAPRLSAADPASADGIVEDIAGFPGLERSAIELARERLEHYATLPDEARPIHQSRDEFRAGGRARRTRLLTALGTALLASDSLEEGRAALRESLDLSWSPDAARALIESSGATGDGAKYESEVRRLAALVAADPLPTASPLEGVEPTAEELMTAREILIDALVAPALTGDVPDATFLSRVGRHVPIDDGGTTLVAVWQSVAGPGHADMPALTELTPRLAASGVRVLLAVPEQELDLAIGLAANIGAQPVVDESGSATENFGGWYAYAYVVVHDGWYSVHYDFTEAARLALLRSNP